MYDDSWTLFKKSVVRTSDNWFVEFVPNLYAPSSNSAKIISVYSACQNQWTKSQVSSSIHLSFLLSFFLLSFYLCLLPDCWSGGVSVCLFMCLYLEFPLCQSLCLFVYLSVSVSLCFCLSLSLSFSLLELATLRFNRDSCVLQVSHTIFRGEKGLHELLENDICYWNNLSVAPVSNKLEQINKSICIIPSQIHTHIYAQTYSHSKQCLRRKDESFDECFNYNFKTTLNDDSIL